MTDKISDMINRLKNAGAVGHEIAVIPYSKLNFEILSLLSDNGFIVQAEKRPKKDPRFIDITLLYKNSRPRIRGVKRLSKPSRRLYKGVGKIRRVKGGYGIEVLSTPKGLMTDIEARKQKVGGEALFTIW